MKPARYFSKSFNVLSDGGTKIGVIVPAHYFSPLSEITIDLPESVPMVAQVFMLWLIVHIWTGDA